MADETITNESVNEAFMGLNVFMAEYMNKNGRISEMAIALLVTTAQFRAALGDEADEELVEASKAFVLYRAERFKARQVAGWVMSAETEVLRIRLKGYYSAESWNAEHPVGTRVRYWPVLPTIESAPPLDTTTRSEAWALGDGAVVVKIVGRSGGVHLAHLELLETTGGKP